jgi:hypothetical protein
MLQLGRIRRTLFYALCSALHFAGHLANLFGNSDILTTRAIMSHVTLLCIFKGVAQSLFYSSNRLEFDIFVYIF